MTRGIPALCTVALLGCGADLPSLEFSSDRVDIGTTTARPCRGDLDWLDSHVEFIERQTGVRGPSKIELYLYRTHDELPCTAGASGCYFPDGYITSLWHAVGHELVHSVTRNIDYRSAFWSEGVAEAYSGEGLVRGEDLQPEHLREQTGRRVNYNNAGHLSRYIGREWGDESLMAVASGADIEATLGLTTQQLIYEHRDDRAYSIPEWSPCDHEELPQTEPGVWTASESFTCDDPNVSQFEWDGIARARRVTLPTDGRYRIEVDGGNGVLMVGCHLEDLAEEPDPIPSNGDLLNQADGNHTAFGTFFESGTPHEVEATAGTYRLALDVPDDDIGNPITVSIVQLG